MAGSSMSGIYSVLDDERLVADFFRGLGGARERGFSNRITTAVSSDSETEFHAWLGMVSPMREWLGEAVGKELSQYKAFLQNKDYESTLQVQKGDLRRDKTGGIRRRMSQLGQVAGRQRDILVSNLIDDGEAASGASQDNFRDLSGRAYDNQAYFDTDHNESGSNQTNDLTNTEVPSADVSDTSAPTATEMEGIITETIGHFYGLTDDQGEPINGDMTRFMVMVGRSDYWAPATAAVNNLQLSGGETNRLQGLISAGELDVGVVFNPRLPSSETKVWVFATTDNPGSQTGPFIWQEEVMPQLEENDPGPTAKYIEAITWGTHAAGYGLWQRGALVTLS